MPHAIRGPTGFGGLQTVQRGATSPANIRFLIDQRGFQEFGHGEFIAPITVSQLQENTAMPGGLSTQLSFRGPAGIFTDTSPWIDLIRDTIDKFIGGGGSAPGSGFQDQGPITDRPFVPEFIDKMLSGTLPRGARPYIDLEDGTVGCISGYHPEKQGKGYCVRNRRMNSLNPRALSRASRRVGGFARAVKRARTLKRICKTL